MQSLKFLSISLLWVLIPWNEAAIAQSIVPADSHTQVNRHGNRFDIEGGRRSADGANLFHSLDRFGLSHTEIANFRSNPDLQNILVRVTGGNASVIDGLLQISGGRSNLFLMNPAGILFGQNARLDLPAAFTVTTASSIGFGGGEFNGVGEPDYAALVGNPTRYGFGLGQPGAIANAGNLHLNEGQRLTFLAGSISHTGQITVPGGQITLTAVPGSSLVRLSQPNGLLSVDVDRTALTTANLPTLLTGGNLRSATSLTLGAEGSVNVTGGLDVSASVQGGAIDIRSPNITVDPGAVINADALGVGDGGQVILQANQTDFLGSISARGGDRQGNGGFAEVSGNRLRFEGQVDTSALNGEWGTLLLDPRDIYISYDNKLGQDPLDSRLNPMTLMRQRSNIIVEATNNITLTAGVSLNFAYNLTPSNGSTGGDITFTADSDRTGGGDFIMETGSSIFTNGRRLSISAANIDTQSLYTYSNVRGSRAGDISLIARGTIEAENINAAQYSLGSGDEAGNVTIRSEGEIPGDISVRSIDTRSIFNTGNGGDVTIVGDRVHLRGLVPLTLDSITTTGIEPGRVNISHAGGRTNFPFVVNDSSFNTGEHNGTLGTINTGSLGRIDRNSPPSARSIEITPTTSTIQPVPGVSITSVNQPPVIAPAESVVVTKPTNSSSVMVTLPPLSALDRNGDDTSFIVSDLPNGARLSRNGRALVNGATVAAGDVLEYTPPMTQTGEALAFRVMATDRNPLGAVLSQSTNAYQLRLQIPTNTRPSPIPIEGEIDGEAAEIRSGQNSIYLSGNQSGNRSGNESGRRPGRRADNPDQTSSEQEASQEFDLHLGLNEIEDKTPGQAQAIAQEIAQATGTKPALLYIDFAPETIDPASNVQVPENEQLELTLISAQGQMRRRVPVSRSQFFAIANEFRSHVTDPRFTQTQRYQPAAQQLYQWIIAPISEQLQAQQITNITFIPNAGLRSLPYAALYDGKQFLIEQYSVGLMPSLSLTDTRYTNIQNSQILAMGISEPTQGEAPLPAVPTEIATLMSLWKDRGAAFLNQNATLARLRQSRQNHPYGIIHMATHANFASGGLDQSYIQLWNQKLQLDQLRELGWNDPPVEMLVLSACRTALGDTRSELGFAGLAVQAGVKTVVASLWSVNDDATTALMAEFYHQLNTASIKAEALRRAQVALLHSSLSHPYYWASFTMVGNPW
jgi:filamentous hemagglutinin family protein